MKEKARSSSSSAFSREIGRTTFAISALSAMLGRGFRPLARGSDVSNHLTLVSSLLGALSRRRWRLAAVALVGGFVIVLGAPSSSVRAATPSCAAGTTLNVVAHEDDDLLFMNPSVLHDIQSGRCVVTVFATAGDAGLDSSYWLGREQGSEAAYANMTGLPDSWDASTLSKTDGDGNPHLMHVETLNGDANISLVFIRLPDGHHGDGFPSTGNESLQKLWESTAPYTYQVHSLGDGSSAYTRPELVDVLAALMNQYQPDTIRTQDYLGYAPGDHSDHYATARFANLAQLRYPTSHTFVGYIGYATSDSPLLYSQNVTGSELTAKENAFYAYAAHDSDACASAEACAQPPYDVYYPVWLAREYGIPIAHAGLDRAVDAGSAVVLNGSASTGRDSDALNYTWVQTVGPTVTLSGANTATPSFTAPANGTTLRFELTVNDGPVSDSSSVTITVTPLSDLSITKSDGASTVNASSDITYTLVVSNVGPSDVSSAIFKDAAVANLAVSSVTCDSASGGAVCPATSDTTRALMEGTGIVIPTLPDGGAVAFKVTGTAGTGNQIVNTATIDPPSGTNDPLNANNTATDINTINHAPAASAGPDQSVNAGSTVTLDGSASTDPDHDSLTYKWEQTGGPAVVLSNDTAAKPTFAAPASTTSLTFKLTVDDGRLTNTDTVTITVSDSTNHAVKRHKRPQTTLLKMRIRSAKQMAIFRFSGFGGKGKLRFQCRLDKQRFSSCRVYKRYEHLQRGGHVFRVRAKDANGLVDLTLVTKRFKI